MRATLLSLGVGLVSLVLGGSAQAHDNYRHYDRHEVVVRHGRSFEHRVWDEHHHRWHYYDGGARVYYFWDLPSHSYIRCH